MKAKKLISIIFYIILSVLINCSHEDTDKKDTQNFNGIWFNPDFISEQGMFSAEIEITGGEKASGTITLENHAIGTVNVSGKYYEEIDSSNYSRYYSIDLIDDLGTLTISANSQNGYGFAGVIDYSDTSGSKQYRVYTAEEKAVNISEAIKTSLAKIDSIAVSEDGSIWAFGAENAEDESDSIYKLNPDGSIAQGPYILSETYPFISGIFDNGDGFLWFIKETITINEYEFEEFEYDLYKIDEDTFSIESETDLSCFIMGDSPIALSYCQNNIYVVYGFVSTKILELDSSGNTLAEYPGVIDASGISVAGNKVYFLYTGRSFDNFLQVSDLDGSELKTYLSPGDTTSDQRILGDTVYFSTSDGWILKMPKTELESGK